ncbi:diaminopimelate dehydrogenase [Peptoniphilus asaccharolyticus DSM 20463]|uniref:Meso-diaminopimelate D-dehydrogenase n=1 Tax=Peptoniphilus asaccharolyticus DSM 20463 TaxID=573058 RepID=A0A1W1UIH4_PEPAS|nr:diaminopimelate dehydrogenase [Peptoniphilus asaccharolyticus]MBL7574769.1 diaminopimelate dehydrogenase [Peptoniphilus asaccharolyticus]SMB80832.1 diaminopimelate dehydrogenase [Peptoniphilus asaccharolyticus DSM 20463]
MIRVGIVGYGNLGRSLEALIDLEENMELVKIFTRRDPSSIDNSRMESLDNILDYKGKIDVMVLALGSATDIPEMGPKITEHFNTVDSFDTHAKIPEYFAEMDKISKENNLVSFISTGWDPGLFSLNRMIAESILPRGNTNTFWGKGVSQGHSDAVRRIAGVKNAIQYTIPKQEIIDEIYNVERSLKSYETHLREVFVVAEEGANQEDIRNEIVTMKNYFDEYETIVNFISEEEFEREHTGMPHGGHVIRVGETPNGKEIYKLSLELDSNPDFTASVNVACIRACQRFFENNNFGSHTVLDTPPVYYASNNINLLNKYL